VRDGLVDVSGKHARARPSSRRRGMAHRDS
jgi:hypothetical protein